MFRFHLMNLVWFNATLVHRRLFLNGDICLRTVFKIIRMQQRVALKAVTFIL